MSDEKENMAFWDSVCETDPKITKGVKYGKRAFTAVNPQAQIMRATAIWGPYGGKWGMRNLAWTMIGSGPTGIMMEAEFYCPIATFPIATDMAYKANEDCAKKCLTDATTKALSKIGFNADIFLGRWDDNKYVAEMTKKHTEPKEQTTPDANAPSGKPRDTRGVWETDPDLFNASTREWCEANRCEWDDTAKKRFQRWATDIIGKHRDEWTTFDLDMLRKAIVDGKGVV